MAKKVALHLAGSKSAPPSLEDLIKLVTQLTGRKPTSAEIAEAREMYAEGEPKAKPSS
jgi:hypothetical protein